MSRDAATPAFTVHVNRIACDGRGLCAELLPELIRADDWGYPIVATRAVPAELLRQALRAVAACPVAALRLIDVAPATAPKSETTPSRPTGSPQRPRPS